MFGEEQRQSGKTQSEIKPPTPLKSAVRRARWWDLNPRAWAGLAILTLAVGAALFLHRHPAAAKKLAQLLLKPQATTPSPESSSSGEVKGASLVTAVAPAPAAPAATNTKNTRKARSEIPKPDSPETLRDQARIEEFRTEAQQEAEKLRALQEERDQATQQAADAKVQAEAQAREDAEAQARAAREAAARAEAQAQEAQAAEQKMEQEEQQRAQMEDERIRNYSGPRSGTIVWQGDVRGTELVTIQNSQASSGTVVGGLPGVPVLIQPDSKKVGIASSPGPRNN